MRVPAGFCRMEAHLIDLLPPEARAVVQEFRTCEFTTLTKDGTPSTWPVSARYLADQQRFLLTTSIGLPNKVFHIRRNPKVALLFSNPTGSGLSRPPAVLVQGDAVVGDQVVTSFTEVDGLRDYWLENIVGRQPASAMFSSGLMRGMMDWYYMRLIIYIRPRAVYWWPNGDFSQPACKVEAAHVE